jgi:hypothetical protein
MEAPDLLVDEIRAPLRARPPTASARKRADRLTIDESLDVNQRPSESHATRSA